MDVGKKLRLMRYKRELTLKDVEKMFAAVNIKVPYNTLSAYETNIREPSFDKLGMFAKFYNVPVGYFFGDKISKKSITDELLDRLIDDNIITSSNKISEEISDVILNTAKADLQLRLMRAEN